MRQLSWTWSTGGQTATEGNGASFAGAATVSMLVVVGLSAQPCIPSMTMDKAYPMLATKMALWKQEWQAMKHYCIHATSYKSCICFYYSIFSSSFRPTYLNLAEQKFQFTGTWYFTFREWFPTNPKFSFHRFNMIYIQIYIQIKHNNGMYHMY